VALKYGIPLNDLPAHCKDAVEAAETSRARTAVTRDGRPIAAIVPMADLDRIAPPDPGADGTDPLLAMCGACRHDAFVDGLVSDLATTGLWTRG
jgi:prevent-host-death family protein